MTGGVQYFDLNATERNFVTTVMQARFIQLVLPEFVFRLEQVDLGTGVIQYTFDAVNMIVMAMGEQDIGNFQVQFARALDNAVDILGRIDYRGTACGNVFHQVDKIFHRPQFQRVYLESRFRHGPIS